ncbi:MAG: DUF3710 domain-containing protein [Micromonosporaceae bacterium]
MFFRRRRPGRHAEDGDVFSAAPDVDSEDDEETLQSYVGGLSGDEAEREGGPYDIEEAPDDDLERLDLGSLKIPKVSDVEIRMQADPQGGATDVVLVADDSALQVGAFAAPRSDDIWDEVRAELVSSITSEGGNVSEIAGRFGTELRARVRTPNGPADVRFVGVDGPRWFVRGLYQGRAATDPDAGKALDECLLGLVVERDKEARPVREPLPLTLPEDIAQQIAAEQAAQSGADPTVAEEKPATNGRPARRR